MTEKTKAAVSGTSTGSGEDVQLCEANIPCRYSSTEHDREQRGFIERLLPVGAENAVTMRQLMKLTGLTARKVRSCIMRERAAGTAILTVGGAGGYFLPDAGEKGRSELQQFVRLMTAIGVSTLQAAEPAKRMLRQAEGQQSIGGEFGGE